MGADPATSASPTGHRQPRLRRRRAYPREHEGRCRAALHERPAPRQWRASRAGAQPRLLDMSKSTRNSGKPWTPADVTQLRQLARGNTPTRVAGLRLGRTPGAVQSKASEMGISLKPTNQSPYNRRGK